MNKYAAAFGDGFLTTADPLGLILGKATDKFYIGSFADKYSIANHNEDKQMINKEKKVENPNVSEYTKPIERNALEQAIKGVGDVAGLATWYFIPFLPLVSSIPMFAWSKIVQIQAKFAGTQYQLYKIEKDNFLSKEQKKERKLELLAKARF